MSSLSAFSERKLQGGGDSVPTALVGMPQLAEDPNGVPARRREFFVNFLRKKVAGGDSVPTVLPTARQ